MTTERSRKIALVLAGGGLTGAVYEIGALRAINDLLQDRTVNDFDIIVGTSAGAIVGSLLANGMSPTAAMDALAGRHVEVRALWAGDLFRPNYGEVLGRLRRFPGTVQNALRHYSRNVHDMNLWDFIWTLIEVLPSGLYDGTALEGYMASALNRPGLSNDFRALNRELYIIATDLDTGHRAVFGNDQNSHVPISLAVAASSAVPLLYKPVRIGQRDYIDGGMRGNASIDLAIEHGAKLIVCINPLVPLNNQRKRGVPMLGPDGTFISDKGMQAIGSQVIRIMMRSGLNYHIKTLRRRHPDVDIILIEPRADDYQMFFYNIMRYSARLLVAEHGYQSVTLDLADRYHEFKDILSRHDLHISRRRVIQHLEELTHVEEHEPPAELASPTAPATVASNPIISQLDQALRSLDSTLDTLHDSRSHTNGANR
ncbi:patatin-like phospholipase family protein [Candidatus Amarolinea aalborgensis]|uniref:patatin-like phospholipase family protein n=1 Tax=Candidatus Amarolinea aalborgensis TaxID=2249329 RepID=UPI003BF97900